MNLLKKKPKSKENLKRLKHCLFSWEKNILSQVNIHFKLPFTGKSYQLWINEAPSLKFNSAMITHPEKNKHNLEESFECQIQNLKLPGLVRSKYSELYWRKANFPTCRLYSGCLWGSEIEWREVWILVEILGIEKKKING